MKLIAQTKLLPTPEQAQALRQTLEVAKTACNYISNQAWDHQTFRQFSLHKLTYYAVKEMFQLAAQMVVRCIAKVADADKLDRKAKRTFRPDGAVAFDNRILTWCMETRAISIWTVAGRTTLPFTCGQRQLELLLGQRAESDQCGFSAHADYVASLNIRDRAIVNSPMASTFGLGTMPRRLAAG